LDMVIGTFSTGMINYHYENVYLPASVKKKVKIK
jgi:hypothetical protein